MNSGGDIPAWQRRLKQDVGENPTRFLDQRIPQIPESPTSFLRARIDGIDRIEVVGAWLAAERKLATEQGREPRSHVIDLLEQRREFLQDHGERPENLRTEWPHELPERYQPTDRDVPPKQWSLVTTDGDRVPFDDHRGNSASAKLQSLRTDADRVEADGGETR